MEYGKKLCVDQPSNDNFTRYIGYGASSSKASDSRVQKEFYNLNTVKLISRKITEITRGVREDNKAIIVPDNIIYNVMSQVQLNFRPVTGDIYTRYIMQSGLNSDDYITNMIDQTIEVITNSLINETLTRQNNEKLTIWTTVLGEGNSHNLRSHSHIKVRVKRPNPFEFHMKY